MIVFGFKSFVCLNRYDKNIYQHSLAYILLKLLFQKITLAALLLFLFNSFTFAQVKNHPYSGTVVLTLEGIASNSKTDYAASETGFGARGLAEYFFPTSTSSNFGLRIYGATFSIKGKDDKKDLKKFKTDMYLLGAGVSYSYSIEDRFFPYIYGGPSVLLFYPRDEFGKTAPNASKKTYDQNVIELEGEVGFRLNIQDNINLNASVSYHLSPTDYLDDIAIGSNGDGFLTASLGISVALFGTKDLDGDGIEDSKDRCPNEPEDFDGFQDDDGCPDIDNDGDGILDINDKCPNAAEDIDGFEDEDGCPDVDNDNDGILDVNDRCPNVAEDLDGYEDNDGCPDLDNDQDGILDAYDKCTNLAEDIDGFEDDDGCPDYDNDRDGILDVNDKCPDEPEDVDGYLDEDGCPDYDNDNDGIADSVDNCPNEPETKNGYNDDDGCPDVSPSERAKSNNSKTSVSIPLPNAPKTENTTSIENLPNAFLLYGVLTFVDEKAEIKSSGYKELDRIASIIKQFPQTKWRIEGYLDNDGSEYRIKTLSTNRAKAVLSYFVSKGLPYSQFEAAGMGDKNPIESNDKPYGRSKNRRIEIKRVK